MRGPDRPTLAADGDTNAGADTTPVVALRAAIDREYPTLIRSAQVQAYKSRLMRSRDEVAGLADDLLSEAVARAMARADRWNPDGPVWPWIAAFVANVIRERITQRIRERRRFERAAPAGEDDAIDFVTALAKPAPFAPDRLFELLDLVEEPARSLLRLAYVNEVPDKEIARRLNITHGNVRVRLLRARQQFRRAYHAAEQGGRS